MKYQFIHQQRPQFPVRVLCEVLEVSESGYYGWRKRQERESEPSRHQKEDQELTARLESVFEQSRQTYGSPRIHAALRRQGVSCSRHRVARLMRKKGLVSLFTAQEAQSGYDRQPAQPADRS